MAGPLHFRSRSRGLCCGLAFAAALAGMSPLQAAGHFTLKARLSPVQDAFDAQGVQQGSVHALKARASAVPADSPDQLGSRHVLKATLAVSPMVCYSDTIFRDNFDWL